MAKSPAEVLQALNETGVTKAYKSPDRTLVMAMMAGAYIGFAAMLATLSATGWEVGGEEVFYGMKKIVFGAVFSVGLMLVLIPGAELFTGNILLSISLAKKNIGWLQMGRNWLIVWCGNLIGAVLLAWVIAGPAGLLDGHVGETAMKVANSKISLSIGALLSRSILANWIVCLAVVMAAAADDISGKIWAIFFPIMGFAAAGFEHSIANMYFLPAGILAQAARDGAHIYPNLNIPMAVRNIGVTTLGNIIGGAVFVAGAYLYVHRTSDKS